MKRITVRLAAGLATLILLVGGSLAVRPAPAAAAVPPGCLTPYVCLFAGTNYTGFSIYYNVTAAANQGCKTLPSSLNNNIESVYGNYLNSGKIVIYYNSHNCSAPGQWSSTGGAYPDVSPYRNTTSSIKILSLP